jgi:uncharacterized protein YkwD
MGVVLNAYRCHFQEMLRWSIAVAAALLVALPSTAMAGLTRTESSLLQEINRVRTQHGLGRLRADAHLERAARAHSREMLAHHVFAHGAFGSRMLQYDVSGSFAGENLAWGTGLRGTATGVVVAWLASPEHRANLLRPSFTRVGIGDLTGSFLGFRGAHVITADFAG